ncbi:hypothetical protein BU17DRAFT_101612 [Hysterangium stoloniferum]|nr:hypothetical protein BU17DRAFT_101612 [Hysterangium stoloniferum]
MAMAVTALILGLQPSPEISLHERFPEEGTKLLHLSSVIQSYTIFAFVFALLVKAETFGSDPGCNSNAVVVLFRPFIALKGGRIVGWVVAIIVLVIYTAMTVNDYSPIQQREVLEKLWIQVTKLQRRPISEPTLPVKEDDLGAHMPTDTVKPVMEDAVRTPQQAKDLQPQRPVVYDANIAGDLVAELVVILILWSLAVMNTELLIKWNKFQPSTSSQSQWQFGQVLPLFLVVLPITSTLSAFRENGLRRLNRPVDTKPHSNPSTEPQGKRTPEEKRAEHEARCRAHQA